jgi:hypothetical protein
MNHVGIAGNLTQFKTDMAVIKQYNPKITFLLGETNSDYVNLNMAQYEGVFGSALWLVDYLLFGMTVVSPADLLPCPGSNAVHFFFFFCAVQSTALG